MALRCYTMLFVWLCLASHPQRGYLETAPPFTVPWDGREARFLHSSRRESTVAWQSILNKEDKLNEFQIYNLSIMESKFFIKISVIKTFKGPLKMGDK